MKISPHECDATASTKRNVKTELKYVDFALFSMVFAYIIVKSLYLR